MGGKKRVDGGIPRLLLALRWMQLKHNMMNPKVTLSNILGNIVHHRHLSPSCPQPAWASHQQ
jgi:hypothetical protein